MLELVKRESDGPVDLLDLGCGLAHLYEYIQRNPPDPPVRYSGLDVSSKLLAVARRKFPDLNFYKHDVLAGIEDLPRFDYLVLNGVFTYRVDISYERMLAYWQDLLLQCSHSRGRDSRSTSCQPPLTGSATISSTCQST